MTRAKKARQQRQRAAAPPPVRSTGAARKANPKVIAGVAGVIAIAVIVAVVFAVTGNKSSSSTPKNVTTLPDAAAATRLFHGIPQHGNVLGSPSAPATLVQYIDLQCPFCREFETTVMPSVVSRYVRTGKLKVVSRPVAILGPDSEVARRAAIVSLQHNRLFDFVQLLYFNQGVENSGWVTNQLLADAFASTPGINADAAMAARNTPAVAHIEQQFDRQSNADNVRGTPTVLIGKSGGKLTEITPGGVPTFNDIKAAVERAQ
ncbi:MAG TPA: thioredoxin domain-containing protein [Gaiellaceae bacterium]|nr:thioredoxin domain-containing protein [Gaiellaceae bacterium]